MKKLLALFFILTAISSLAQNILFDTASFVQGGYLFKAPQDNIFDWNETRYMPYSAKKTTDPGYPYFYTNTGAINWPTYINKLCLDGMLYSTSVTTGSYTAPYNSYGNFWPTYAAFSQYRAPYSNSHWLTVDSFSGYLWLTSYGTNGAVAKSNPVYIGDNTTNGGRVNEQVIIDPASTRFDINMSKVRLNKGTPGKWLYLDANKEVAYTDLPGALWSVNGSKIYYNTGSVGIGTSDPLAPIDVHGYAKISDSIITPLISNYGNLNIHSYSDESTTNARVTLSGSFGRASLSSEYLMDHSINKGHRQCSFSILSSSSTASLFFGKNDSVILANYRWDTTSFYTDVNRKDLGKSALPWRNLYAQHVYSNGTELMNGLRYSDTISKLATRYWAASQFTTESFVNGKFLLMQNPVGSGIFIFNGRDAFMGDSIFNVGNYDETHLGGGHFEGGLKVDKNISIGGILGIGTTCPSATIQAVASASAAILVTNSGGAGGAAFQMNDISGASNWFFKATSTGFKIRDNTNLIDVISIEKASAANSIYIKAGGNIGVGTPTPTALIDVNSNGIRVRLSKTPASATASGNTGDICWDASYIYVCTATNTWRRSAISNW